MSELMGSLFLPRTPGQRFRKAMWNDRDFARYVRLDVEFPDKRLLVSDEHCFGVWENELWTPQQWFITNHGLRSLKELVRYDAIFRVLLPFDISSNILQLHMDDGLTYELSTVFADFLTGVRGDIDYHSGRPPVSYLGRYGRPGVLPESLQTVCTKHAIRRQALLKTGAYEAPIRPSQGFE